MRRHLIESWDDSLIEVGSDWRAAIEKALDTCNLALLLVSPDFLASEFIHSVELKRVLDRREREGIRVVPIILRPCLWTSEPIGTLQALPEDGTPIITFPPETGARDQAWTDIVRKLAQWAEEDRKRCWGGDQRPWPYDDETVIKMAKSSDPLIRDFIAKELVKFYDHESDKAKDLLKKLLEADSEEVPRTALKAFYYIGSGAQDILLWIAERTSPQLRQAAKDTLYLIWRRDPDFIYVLLHNLLGLIRINPMDLVIANKRNSVLKTIEFFIDLTITIYINHCDQEDVKKQTADLYYKLATEKLHLPRLKTLLETKIVGPGLERLVLLPVILAFSKPILKILLYTELQPPERFFSLPTEERACLKRIAPALDPDTDLKPLRNDLSAMLQSDILFLNRSAALALAIHAYHDFPKTEALLRQLFDKLNARGRLWELFSFSVLLRQTPPQWVELLEGFTQRLIQEHPETFYNVSGILGRFDFIFIPLGLAYGKLGPTLPLFEDLIRKGLKQADWHFVTRCIRALGPLGFYYPKAVFSTLRESIPNWQDKNVQGALVEALATIRTLHFDAVDKFVLEMGMDETFQDRISAAADVALVHRYISWLGHYNNAVHQSLFYPKMRRAFTMGELVSLADARMSRDFILYYTTVAFRMAQEADFRLIEWTRPE
jgi:hypothetical protein